MNPALLFIVFTSPAEPYKCSVKISDDSDTAVSLDKVLRELGKHEGTQDYVKFLSSEDADDDTYISVHKDSDGPLTVYNRNNVIVATDDNRFNDPPEIVVANYLIRECTTQAIWHYRNEATKLKYEVDNLTNERRKLKNNIKPLILSGGGVAGAGFIVTSVALGIHVQNVRKWTNPVSDSLPMSEEVERRKNTEQSIGAVSVGVAMVGTGVGLIFAGIGLMMERRDGEARDRNARISIDPALGGFAVQF